ncbi:MAG: asparagine synthase (glutamine-hydrolyzing) [Verrucomicrobia bacterium]|nr:asparagine synthase (glutamine-hydrolyzing) [Verrucomicrobiota bacterium]
MCGIAGMWSKEPVDEAFLCSLADTMLGVISHRGPDDGGYVVGPNVFVGNRRLSIFDLSEAGNQPFFSRDGKVWLVFNGEIYNHFELRGELEGEFEFKSHTDTEVLLHAYEKWGMACVDRFIGMFAFAIWDTRKEELVLCRDRLGIKPFYYHFDGKKLVFGSEIKALLAAGIEARPNHSVLRDYLVSGFYDHTGQTFFDGIVQVKAGHLVTVGQAGLRESCYWNLSGRPGSSDLSAEAAERRYLDLLEDSIRLRMRADVPCAIMLSGGLDSSALAHIADGYKGSHELNVMTFRHAESRYDEGPYADLVSKGRNWKSYSVVVRESDVGNMLRDTLWHQDEPFGGVANLADVMLSALARQNGIYVLLEGQGADETLGGYEYYYLHHLLDLLERDESAARNLYSRYAALRGSKDPASKASFDAFILKAGKEAGHLSQDGTAATRREVLSGDLLAREGTGYKQPALMGSLFQNALFRDLVATKVPRVLRFKDKSSMMHGVELRVPFLDHRLVEHSFSIRPESKLADGYTKVMLRRAMKDKLPEVACFHVKRQVQTPQREWLRGPLQPLVAEVINSRSFGARGLFDQEAAISIYQEYIARPESYPNSFFIWQWLMVEWWFRLFIDKTEAPARPTVNRPNTRRYPSFEGRAARAAGLVDR